MKYFYFTTQVHEDLLLEIDSNDLYDDYFMKRLKAGNKNNRGVVNYKYSFDLQKHNDSDGGAENPDKWIDANLKESITITSTQREHGDTIIFWVQATDILGNNAITRLTTHIDTSPPTPPSSSVTFLKETNKAIKGIPHFTTR